MNVTDKFSRYLQKNKYRVFLAPSTPNPDLPQLDNKPKSKEYAKLSMQIVRFGLCSMCLRSTTISRT